MRATGCINWWRACETVALYRAWPNNRHPLMVQAKAGISPAGGIESFSKTSARFAQILLWPSLEDIKFEIRNSKSETNSKIGEKAMTKTNMAWFLVERVFVSEIMGKLFSDEP